MSASSSHVEKCAAIARRFPQRWFRHYASSKLRSDPVFPAAARLLAPSRAPLLDLGCGIGLLPAYLRASGYDAPVLGIDIDRRKIEQAQRAGIAAAEFLVRDLSENLPPFSGNVALIDVLHYLDPGAQAKLLAEVATRISADGLLLLRDGMRDGSGRYRMTYAGELFAQAVSWNIGRPLHFPTRDAIRAAFPPDAFTVEDQPMYGRTPFNNWLFVVRRSGAQLIGMRNDEAVTARGEAL